jgi:hypothetical protein
VAANRERSGGWVGERSRHRRGAEMRSRIGMDWIGLIGLIGLDWIGWIGLDRMGVDCFS